MSQWDRVLPVPQQRMLKTLSWVNDWAGCSLAGAPGPTPSSGTPGGGGGCWGAVQDATLREGGHGQKDHRGRGRDEVGGGGSVLSWQEVPGGSGIPAGTWRLCGGVTSVRTPKVHIHPEPQNGTLLGNSVFGDVIKMQSY